jgi:hypothetical protein
MNKVIEPFVGRDFLPLVRVSTIELMSVFGDIQQFPTLGLNLIRRPIKIIHRNRAAIKLSYALLVR